MYKSLIIGLAVLSATACTQKSAYEAAVEDLEPRYCYKSLAGVTCYDTPYHRDEKRLVNYFGPAPKRYEKPELPAKPKYFAPETVNYWVKDPEPIPEPAPSGDIADRPWLAKKVGVEVGPSLNPNTYRVRREGATYIIQELPAETPEKPVIVDAEKLKETAETGSF